MSVGKRTSTDQPLTEHDIAERLDRTAARLLTILIQAREMGLMDQVKHSRYFTNASSGLAAELQTWGIEAVPLRHTPGPENPETVSPGQSSSLADQSAWTRLIIEESPRD